LDSVEDFRFIWEAIKGFIKDNVTSFASFLNRTRNQRIVELEKHLAFLERAQQNSFSPLRTDQLSLVKSELNSILGVKAEFLIKKSREHHYFNGSRPSHQLALRLNSNERRACISAIQCSGGNIVTTPTEINAAFVCFYKDLYKSDIMFNKERCKNFLTDVSIRKLSEMEAAELGENISLKELCDAVQEMRLGKSPGPDGIPIEILIFNYIPIILIYRMVY